jgi:hypothetical protein
LIGWGISAPAAQEGSMSDKPKLAAQRTLGTVTKAAIASFVG